MRTAIPGRYLEVRLKNVRIERGGRTVIEKIDWTIRPGQRWILVGGNGAGKTQLLKLVAGSVWPAPTGLQSRHYRWRDEVWTQPHGIHA